MVMLPAGCEVIKKEKRLGMTLQTIRTPYGNIVISNDGLFTKASKPHEPWDIGEYEYSESKPQSDMMNADNMRRYLKGRQDL